MALALVLVVTWGDRRDDRRRRPRNRIRARYRRRRISFAGPVFGALMELLRRPAILPVLLFILVFKLPDAAMGFMVKPFWVDAGFSAAQIGLVSVNIGLALSIAGGIAGGWITDRIGIFRGLWMLGLAQAVSNLGYWVAGGIIPLASPGRGGDRSSTRRFSMRRARRSRSRAGSARRHSSRS